MSMQLLYTPTSPYARKTRVTVIEKGLGNEVAPVVADPFSADGRLRAANPLGKVPVLIRTGLPPLFDSPIICALLDELGAGPKLRPGGEDGWLDRRREALCDGILDVAFSTVMEQRRPPAQRSADWLDRWRMAIRAAVAALEEDCGSSGLSPTAGSIALGCALGYLDFRLPGLNWRASNPMLERWFEDFARRPAMVATAPVNQEN